MTTIIESLRSESELENKTVQMPRSRNITDTEFLKRIGVAFEDIKPLGPLR